MLSEDKHVSVVGWAEDYFRSKKIAVGIEPAFIGRAGGLTEALFP